MVHSAKLYFSLTRRFVLLLLAICSLHFCNAQPIDLHYVDSVVKQKATPAELTKKNLYVVNGVPYQSEQVDEALAKNNAVLLTDILIVQYDSTSFYHYNMNLVLVQFAYDKKPKHKRKNWNMLKKEYHNNTAPPALLINNQYATDAMASARALRLRDILYIDSVTAGDKKTIRVWTYLK